ncbi:hypothetical protein R6Q57_022143 [Mikania cordata]
MEFQKLIFSVVIILWFLSNIARSVSFEIESGRTKCISEDIKSNSMAVGHYSVINPNDEHPLPESHKLTLRAVEGGDYMACFFAIDHHPAIKFSVEFDWRSGMAAKDWSNVTKKGSIDAMVVELKRLEDAITSIHEEMFYLRERGRDMQQLNKKTNSRMALLSFVSLFVCLFVIGLQVWHLKSFFEKKKLI